MKIYSVSCPKSTLSVNSISHLYKYIVAYLLTLCQPGKTVIIYKYASFRL